MNTLVVDVGGSHIKVLVTHESQKRAFVSGKDMTPEKMMAGIYKIAPDWKWDQVSIGVPSPVVDSQPIRDPTHLAAGWVTFDYAKAFGCPVQLVNDAAMQALGSYEGGKMLFCGLGTGLGTALIVEGQLIALELARLPYGNGKTIEHYIGESYLEKKGQEKWQKPGIDTEQMGEEAQRQLRRLGSA